MASSSVDITSKSKDKHFKETSKEKKWSSHSENHDSESDVHLSSSIRNKSPHRSLHRESSQERRDRSNHLEERRVHYSKERHMSYRANDRTYKSNESYKSKSSSSHYSPPYHERFVKDKSPERSRHRSSEKSAVHHNSSNDKKHYDNRHSNYISPEKVSEHKSNSDRSPQHERYINYKSSDRHNFPSEKTTDYHKQSDERHISYRNTSASGDEEFVASLLQKIDFLSNQVDYFTQENEKLKCSLNNMKIYGSEELAAEVSITFRNKNFEQKFASILKELATDLITGRCSIEALNKLLESTEVSKSESWNPEGELFALDISSEVPMETCSSVPKYDTSFSEVLQSPDLLGKENIDNSKRDSKTFPKTCFNCGGDHFLGECPEKRNFRRIAAARKKHSSKQVTANKRYHICGSQEFDYKPGVISEDLRSALNLEKNQIAPYIYRMRIIDYPPGWLEEAAIESSGIALYGSDGTDQTHENTKDNTTEMKVKYDPDKLIDFPGFNTPLPPDVIDESAFLGLPPMQVHQMRQLLEKVLPKPDAPPSRKRKLILPEPKHKVPRCEVDMDIDDDEEDSDSRSDPITSEFVPPLPTEDFPPPPSEELPLPPADEFPESSSCDSPSISLKIPSQLDSEISSPISDNLEEPPIMIEPFKLKGNLSPTSGTASPSLQELEDMKKRLVIQLGITTESSSPALEDESVSNDDLNSVNSGLACSLGQHFDTLASNTELSNFSDNSTSSDTKITNFKDTGVKLQRTQSSGSKLVSLGTPSISRHSSFTKLPSYDNFSKDVSSHLYFENLPNSTGTFEKMKKVMKKVKEKLNSIMQ